MPSSPRPLADISPDVLAALRGVVFDVDDTVTREGRLELEAYAAMNRLRDAGLKLVCVTGRPLGWADVFALTWPVDVAIGENGAGWVWRDGRSLREGYFDTPEARSQQRATLDRIVERVATEMPDVRLSGDQRARRCDVAFDVGETVQLPKETIWELTAIIHEEGARCPVSSVHAHAVAGAWNKAVGTVRALQDAMAIDLEAERDRWLFVGDSGNDAAAFSFFPISVGVSNVVEHLELLPTPPAFVTTADRGLGFAEVATLVTAGRGD